MRYLNNAFSLSMLGKVDQVTLHVERLSLERVRELSRDAVSVVGHVTTRALFSSLLGFDVAYNRATVTLTVEDELVVGQYCGSRLAEGATLLPDGATVEWYWLRMQNRQGG
jgi:hypothetical protein